jgi:hypothetical protein
MDENEKHPVLNYNTPTSSPPYVSPFLKKPPRAAWIGGTVMLSILVIILIGFLLRSIGVWSDKIAVVFTVIAGVLFIAAVFILTVMVYKAIWNSLFKK